MSINDLAIPDWLIAGVSVVLGLATCLFVGGVLIDRFIAVHMGGVPLKHTQLSDLKPSATAALELVLWVAVPILVVTYVAYTLAWFALAIVPVYLVGVSFWKLYRAG